MENLGEVVRSELGRIKGDVDAFISAQKERGTEFGDKQVEIQARLQAVEQMLVLRGKADDPNSLAGPSVGSEVEKAFRENGKLFAQTRAITLKVNALITSATTGSHGSLDVPMAPTPASTQLAGMLTAEPLDGLHTLHYARRTGVVGAAAAQDDEGVAKANAEPVYTAITQNAITVAGYANVSEQALATAGGLARAIDSHLKKSVRDAFDAILVAGTAATGWPFAGFVALAQTFTGPATYTSLVDAILAGALRMRLQGFNPRIAVLPELGYLTTQLAKDTTGRYLSENYAADLSLALGGMRVGLSAGVTAGKALLIDPDFCGFLGSGEATVTIGYVNDQFTKNMCTLRGETQVIPYFSDYQGAMLVTPAAA